MTTTPLWSIPEVAPSQDQKETTINNALVWLEGALADEYDGIAWTSNAFTLGNNAFAQHMAFKCPDNAGASSTLTVPLLKKFFIVNNSIGSHQVTVGGTTGASVVVPSAAVAILLCDGTDIYTTTALAATSGVLSIGGASGSIGVAGNFSVTGGTLTLAGMAAQAVPPAGIVYSNGTAVSTLTVTSGIAQSGGTLSLASIAAHSLLMNTGTATAAPVAIAISSNLTDSGGTLDLAAQQRLTSVFISHPGTMDNSELLMLVGVSGNQHLRVPANFAGTSLVFNNGTSGSGWPAATSIAVLSTLHSGSWTAQGTITISTAGSLTLPTFGSIDLTTGGDGVRFVGQATADTGFKDFCLTVVLEKIA